MSSEQPEDSTPRTEAEEGVDPEADHPDVADLGYERARDELAEVVRRLEAGGLSLEESLALWERGEALAAVCERRLAGARERVDRALASVEQRENSEQE
ncbi:exodeoxyribonuclease VII small subunit [Actinopolyspora mortivallis]|uniref:Exodeoxyribonuclease 7 small subunit n=1 Tax=Actinopolyspora mortivallis TaxID=33906 RepID=A0A2T0H0L2_ACTMO|nr:exodeoxyribonuclease VII small subunit [Actinopolyspora mortivallis]PRW64895.1 exodeoxyribonuclease VII small subunit [Actinopolyspora mortivallis]